MAMAGYWIELSKKVKSKNKKNHERLHCEPAIRALKFLRTCTYRHTKYPTAQRPYGPVAAFNVLTCPGFHWILYTNPDHNFLGFFFDTLEDFAVFPASILTWVFLLWEANFIIVKPALIYSSSLPPRCYNHLLNPSFSHLIKFYALWKFCLFL